MWHREASEKHINTNSKSFQNKSTASRKKYYKSEMNNEFTNEDSNYVKKKFSQLNKTVQEVFAGCMQCFQSFNNNCEY